MSILGTRVVRTEDPALLTVGGTYVDDLRVPELIGAARATFVRSPMAHARIGDIDVSAARAAPGAIAVLTARDMDDLPPPPPDDGGGGSEGAPVPMGGSWSEPLLAVDRVRYVGEPVAIVLTDDGYQGADAAEQVIVDYQPLPAVLGPGAVDAGTLLFPRTSSNVAVTAGAPADEPAFDGCDVVVRRTIANQRLAPVPMEGRAVAACWADGKLTVWVSTQNAQISRFILAGALGLDPAAIRVITPDVGGGFGAKVGLDRDAIVVAWAARRTGRAVRWAETRSENLVGMTHGRAQLQDITIGGTRDGRVLAYRIHITNASLFQGQGGSVVAVQSEPPSGNGPELFPAAGIIGSRAGASRTSCGRRCAAGLRPVLDLPARSRGMAAARERQRGAGLRWLGS